MLSKEIGALYILCFLSAERKIIFMKKLLAIILACITAVSLCACKLSKKPESSSVPGHSNSSDTSSTVLSSNITGSSSTVSDNVSSNASSNTPSVRMIQMYLPIENPVI